MKQEYFVVYFGEDGISISRSTKEQVQNRLNSDPNGKYVTNNNIKDFYADGGVYPLYETMIIKGELVVPRKIEVITKLEI